MATSVYGNDGYSRIGTTPSADISIQNGTVGDLTAGPITAESVTVNGSNRTTTVNAYVPAAFATGAAASSYYLSKTPQGPTASATVPGDLVVIPGGAVIDRVLVENNGTGIVGLTSVTVGTALSTAALNSAPTTVITAAMLLATVNGGGAVGGSTGVTELVFGGPGQLLGVGTIAGLVVPTTTPDNYVSLTINGTPNTAGDCVVKITYTNP